MANPSLPLTTSAWSALPNKQMDLSDRAVLVDGGSQYERLGAVLARLPQLATSVTAFGAVGGGIVDDTLAIQAAINAATPASPVVLIPAGSWKLTATLNVPAWVSLVGALKAWWEFPSAPDVPASGTWLIKAHNGTCISKVGATNNAAGGMIANLTIWSNKTTYPTGDGIVVDKVSEERLVNLNVRTVGGDAFVVGVTAGDVTTHVYLYDCYSNNAGGKAFNIRAKWTRMYQPRSDNGTHGLFLNGAQHCHIYDFHFEGFTTAGVIFDGAGHTKLHKGYIGNTASALRGIVFENTSGTYFNTIEKVHFPSGPALSKAIELKGSQNIGIQVTQCMIENYPTGIDLGGGSAHQVYGNDFYGNALDISVNADRTRILHNRMELTSGTYSINLVGGSLGIWRDNDLSKPIGPTVGNHGTNMAIDNVGYRTRAAGITGAVASGTTVAHGLAAAPEGVNLAVTTSGSVADMRWSADATNITFTWSGGTNHQISWTTWNRCARP